MTAEPRRVQDHLEVLWRWKLLLGAVVILIPVAVYAIVSSQAKTYESSAVLQVGTSTGDTSVSGSLDAVTPAQTLLSTARLITTTAVARAAAARLGKPRSAAGRLLEAVSATADTEAGFVTIAARAPEAQGAADIADAFAAAAASFRTGRAVRRLEATIASVEGQLARLPRADRAQRRQLSELLARLRVLLDTQDDTTQIVEAAVASRAAVAPRVGRTVVLSGIVALLLGLAMVGLAHGADRKIRRPLELEELTGRPLLCTVPRTGVGDVPPSAEAQEAFRALRASLTSFNADVEVSSVLISSPGRRDGRTTVATNLARSLASAGTDVILVDADLRAPQVAARFGVAATVALGRVLSGDASLDDALVEVDLELPRGGRLRLLPAEPGLSNPSERLAGAAMADLLERLAAIADIVVIDSAPILTCSDALPLVAAVSGVVVVARVDATSKDAVRRVERIVADAGGTLLGSVATGGAAPRVRRQGRRR